MALLVPKEIVHKVVLDKDTIDVVRYIMDKMDVWIRNSIFWRTK